MKMYFCLMLLFLTGCDPERHDKPLIFEKKISTKYCVHSCILEIMHNQATEFMGGAHSSVMPGAFSEVKKHCIEYIGHDCCVDRDDRIYKGWESSPKACSTHEKLDKK